MKFLKKLFSNNKSTKSNASEANDEKQKNLKKKYKLRDSFWEEVGTVDKDVLTFMINPAFQGQPAWPDLRQAYKRIKTDNSVILATDGLSDDFSDIKESNNGFEIELFVEVKDPEYMKMSLDEIKNTWIFQLLNQAALNAADTGAYANMARENDVFSTEFYNVEVPKKFLNEEERAGALIGIKSDKVPPILKSDKSEILILSVTLLDLDNLKYIVKNGKKGREEIVQKLIESGRKNISSIKE